MLLTAVFVRCSGQLSAHYGITKRVESLLQAIQYGQKISSVHHFRYEHSIWSKWRDSNSRPPVPEASRSSLLTTFRTGLPGDSSTRRTLYQFFRTKKHVLDAISRKKTYPFAWGGRGRKFKSCHSDHIECS